MEPSLPLPFSETLETSLARSSGCFSLLSLSILLIPNVHLSSIGLDPKDEDGDGNGCDPVMYTESVRGVWFPPRPLEGGTPTSRVLVSDEEASSVVIMSSTLSIQIKTFSGLRSMKAG